MGGSDAAHRATTGRHLAGHRRRRGGAARIFLQLEASCAKLGTIAVTIVAGPLNYAGVNPKVKC
jgi:hypothetical protein